MTLFVLKGAAVKGDLEKLDVKKTYLEMKTSCQQNLV